MWSNEEMSWLFLTLVKKGWELWLYGFVQLCQYITQNQEALTFYFADVYEFSQETHVLDGNILVFCNIFSRLHKASVRIYR